eukprot:4331207-Pyramimonas_sp.AAC.1
MRVLRRLRCSQRRFKELRSERSRTTFDDDARHHSQFLEATLLRSVCYCAAVVGKAHKSSTPFATQKVVVLFRY